MPSSLRSYLRQLAVKRSNFVCILHSQLCEKEIDSDELVAKVFARSAVRLEELLWAWPVLGIGTRRKREAVHEHRNVEPLLAHFKNISGQIFDDRIIAKKLRMVCGKSEQTCRRGRVLVLRRALIGLLFHITVLKKPQRRDERGREEK